MKDWTTIDKGYALYVVSAGSFIWEICSSGSYGGPGIYKTDYLWEAKAWKTINGATKAATRVAKALGAVMVCQFHYDKETDKRVIDDRFMWAA